MDTADLKLFLTVALPIMLTIFVAVWGAITTNNKRLDDLRGDMNRRFDEVILRLGRIEDLLRNHEERITRLEERTSPIATRGR